MKPFELPKIPKEALEALSFVGAVLFGAIYKVIRLNQEKGVKITLSKMLAEAFMSFFVAAVVFAVFDQFLQFNKFFTYMMCSLAGSMSSVFHSNIEGFISYIFDAAKNYINKKANL